MSSGDGIVVGKVAGPKLTVQNYKTASDYYLYVACGIDDPTVDKLQETRIAISNPFSIQGTQEIDISWSDGMRARFHANSTRVFHMTFLLPKEVNVAEIKKLQDIESHHGKLIAIGKRDVSVRIQEQPKAKLIPRAKPPKVSVESRGSVGVEFSGQADNNFIEQAYIHGFEKGVVVKDRA